MLFSKLIALREGRIMLIGVVIPHAVVLKYTFSQFAASIVMCASIYAVLRTSTQMIE